MVPLFAFPAAIRKMIYTTNAVESLHRSLRKIIKTRGSFPTDEAALKLLFLAIRNAGVGWRRPVEWTAAIGQFAILFGGSLLHRNPDTPTRGSALGCGSDLLYLGGLLPSSPLRRRHQCTSAVRCGTIDWFAHYFVSPMGCITPFPQQAHSLPESRPVVPISRDKTPSPGQALARARSLQDLHLVRGGGAQPSASSLASNQRSPGADRQLSRPAKSTQPVLLRSPDDSR